MALMAILTSSRDGVRAREPPLPPFETMSQKEVLTVEQASVDAALWLRRSSKFSIHLALISVFPFRMDTPSLQRGLSMCGGSVDYCTHSKIKSGGSAMEHE